MSLRRGVVAGLPFILLLSAPALAQDAAPAPVEVRAVEYAFEGLPESVPAGTSFGLVNAGQEDHEFLVMRRAEGTTESVQDLLALPPEQIFAKVELTGGIAARVGQTSGATLTIARTGRLRGRLLRGAGHRRWRIARSR